MNLRLLLSALGLVAASQSLGGCFFLWDRPTPDDPPPALVPPRDEGVSMSLIASRGCVAPAGGCAPTRPLMAGVRETVMFSMPDDFGGALPRIESSDPDLVTIGRTSTISADGSRLVGTFDVHAGARRGSAEVTLSTPSGVAATITLLVDAAAGMDLVQDEGSGQYDRSTDRITLRVGDRVSMNGYPVNLDGVRLLANDGVVWSVPDTTHVRLVWSTMQGARVADDHVYVHGVAPGTEVITVRAGVVERTVVVEVR